MSTQRFNVLESLSNGVLYVCDCGTLMEAQQRVLELMKASPEKVFVIYDRDERKFASLSKITSA